MRNPLAVAVSLLAVFSLSLPLALTACQPPPDGVGAGSGGDDVGVVQVALTSVPSNGTCVRFTTMAGTRAIQQLVSGTANTQLTAALRGLPFGVALSISAEAFAGACTALTTASLATYLSETQTATLVAGETKALTFTLRPTGNVTGTADFLYVTMTPNAFGFPPTVIMQQGPIATFQVANIGMVPTSTITTSIAMTAGAVGELNILPSSTCTGVLMPGQLCVIQVSMTPMTSGPKNGTLTFAAAQGGTLTAMLNGIGWNPAHLTVTPSTAFGDVPLFSMSAPVDLTVMNTGDQPSGPVTLQYSSGEFQQVGSSCGGVPGLGSCKVTVRFFPMASGARTGMLTVNATPGSPAIATLTGNGISPLSFTPSAGMFGSTLVGAAGMSQTFMIRNASTMPSAPLAVVASPAAFRLTSDPCSARVLNPGATCSVTVQFFPTAVGPATGTLTVAGAAGWSAGATLSGTGS